LGNAIPRVHELLEIRGRRHTIWRVKRFNVFLYVMILDGHSPVEKISPEVAGKSLFLKYAGVLMEVIL
jgi:hypothetical protein